MLRRNPQLISDIQPIRRKLMKTDSKTSYSKSKQKHVSVCITDPVKPSRLSSIKALQSVLLWIFTDDQVNPMWINIKFKSAVKHVLTIFVETQGQILQKMIGEGMMNSFDSYWNGKTRVEHRGQQIHFSDQQPWYRLFSSLPLPRKIPRTIQQKIRYSQSIYTLYKAYSLTKQQLKTNLFPVTNSYNTYSYINTTSYPPSQNQPFYNEILGMDCQMVTTTQGLQLAKITIINFNLQKVYEELVMPKNKIINYNTKYSGITQELLKDVVKRIEDIQEDLKKIIFSNTILVGHSLENDLHSIKFIHELIVDTSILFKSQQGLKVSLKNLVKTHFNNNIQQQTHDSYEDAMNAMALAKLKIQILDKLNRQNSSINFDILQKLICSDQQQSAIITCTSTQLPLLKQHNIQIIQLQKQSITSSCSQAKWYFKRTHPGKLLFLSLRRTGVQTWQKYYESLNKLVQSLKLELPKNSLILFNFQLQTNSKNTKFKPYTVFVTI